MPCTHQRQNKVLSTSASYFITWKFIKATEVGQVFNAWYRLYFGNIANNALNIYGTDACFKVRMNHCVKSIPCKKKKNGVCSGCTQRHPPPNIWSEAAITLTGDWGRNHLLTIKGQCVTKCYTKLWTLIILEKDNV